MERFNNQSLVKDIFIDKLLGKYAKYLFYKFPKTINSKRIDDISWCARSGLNFFYEQCEKEMANIYDIDGSRKNAKLIHISHKNHAKICIIISGGALSCIDTFHEGLPIGERMFNEGYDVFLLNYEVGKKAKKTGPSKDINNAVKFIVNNKDKLNINTNDFVLIGGSAGGYIAAQYCSNNLGYKSYNNLKPGCLCLLYPVVDLGIKGGQTCINAIGRDINDKLIKKYSPMYHVKGSFPPTFIVHSKDDDAVPYQGSVRFQQELDKAKIKNLLISYETGGHGWGIGYRLEPSNWFNEFIKFLKSINI